MKKIILAATLLALGATQVPTARANGWPIAAGVFGGLVAGTVIADSIARPPVYYAPSPAPAYYPPPTYSYYPPAPVVTYPTGPAVVYAAPAPRVVVAAPFYPPAPVVTFGFGFGRTYWDGGYYHDHGRAFHSGRW